MPQNDNITNVRVVRDNNEPEWNVQWMTWHEDWMAPVSPGTKRVFYESDSLEPRDYKYSFELLNSRGKTLARKDEIVQIRSNLTARATIIFDKNYINKIDGDAPTQDSTIGVGLEGQTSASISIDGYLSESGRIELKYGETYTFRANGYGYARWADWRWDGPEGSLVDLWDDSITIDTSFLLHEGESVRLYNLTFFPSIVTQVSPDMGEEGPTISANLSFWVVRRD
jgi:hypothetical protein